MDHGENNSGLPTQAWNALFQFALKVGADDPVNRSTGRPLGLSEQDRKFLQDAMDLFVHESDYVAKLKANIATLSATNLASPSQAEIDGGEDALFALSELCCDIDAANDFEKLGGFRLFPALLASDCAVFRAGAADLIGECAQNNPYCQSKFDELRIFDILFALVTFDPDYTCKAKSLFALSCLIRGPDGLREQFFDANGLDKLANVLKINSNSKKLQAKATFLALTLARSDLLDISKKKEMANSELTAVMLDLVRSDDCVAEARQFACEYLHSLLQLLPTCLTRMTDLNALKANLSSRLERLATQSPQENQDEIAAIENLRALL